MTTIVAPEDQMTEDALPYTTTDAPAAFDPGKHLTSIGGKRYLAVRWRLVWLRALHPDARVETELVEHRQDTAVFRARVTLPSGASATGWGMERSDDFEDYLEKAETKALGRALAALGFGTQFCSDYDVGAAQQRVVDAPVAIRSGRAPTGQEATPRQITYLHAVARELGLDHDDLDERAEAAFGLPLGELGRLQVSSLIEQIQAQRPAGAHDGR
jgi:hypothetical protein